MILCCGEALIDMLPHPANDGARAYVPHAGGAVFNTAVALGRLSVSAGFFSGLSTDPFGALLDDALRASRVDTRHVRRSGRPTTLAFVTLSNGQAQYLFYDENTAGRMLEPRDLPVLDDAVDALLFGGISLISEPCGSAYEALMARERDRRAIMLDPNIRPDFIADPRRHRTRIRRMMSMSDIVKLSDEDLAWLTGGDSDGAARGLLDLGPSLVVVTRGADGAIGHTAGRTIAVPARKVDIADTLGAGDTFNAGLLAFLSQHRLLSKPALAGLGDEAISGALAFAARAAAVTVSRPGADPPWRAELG